ncbi:MAG: KUP/HAK/KT family potassium transporter [Methanoregulaceae archaeon]|nr:KUP/HAK/KT family potassium transporter [Methanoregulaceae archaeon]
MFVPHSSPAFKGVIKSMGVVFGDIGTSPIYTLTVIFLLVQPTIGNLVGIVSLIIWTLIILVTIQYAVLAMQLGKKGEGGTIVLRETLVPLLKSSRSIGIISILSIIGVSLLIGDGVITPAISILSAVEGLRLIPGVENIGQYILVWIAAFIAIGLFSFQKRGTERVAWAFGPIMVVWFTALAISGLVSIIGAPEILRAVNPVFALNFFLTNGIPGFFILSQVILCATGGETLFADMGQLGREPITKAWGIVFVALVINYLGQGAFIIQNPEAKNILFEMVFHQAPILYIPFLLLAVTATVIASQAIISGIFSIVYQGITTRIMPFLKIDYTSPELRSQIYIDSVNWFLLLAVLYILFQFEYSERLAAAYGLAVMGTMTLTGVMITLIFYLRKNYAKALIGAFVLLVDIIFLLSTTLKIPNGGYWSLIIASFPFAMIMIYISGQKRLFAAMHPMDLNEFLERYEQVYYHVKKIKGTALFFARDIQKIPAYISHTIFNNNILYEENIIISIQILDRPFGVKWKFEDELAPALRVFSIAYGYMEVISMTKILEEAGIREKTIFYGLEEIVSDNIVWKLFSAMKRLAPSFVQYYKLPSHKIHGVVTRIEM